MEKYEVAVLIKPLLPEDIKSKVLPVIEDLIKKMGGSSTVKDEWGKKHLAYPIKGHEEGYYVFLEMQADPASLNKFEKEMRLIRDVLRFLVIREDSL